METSTANNDHDLLIEVNTNVKNMANTIDRYTSSTSQIQNDHEARIRVLETSSAQLKGAQDSQKKMLNTVSIIGGLIAVTIAVIQFLGR